MDSRAQTWSISTNIPDYAAFGTFNLEGSVAVSRHISVHIGGEYNPWKIKDFQDKKITCEAGIRWWPWNIYSGWWLGTQVQYRQYNRGGLIDGRAEQGDAGGLGLSAGYTLMLHKHINLEFGAGFWAGATKYEQFACTRCGKKLSEGVKGFILPDELIMALVWTF